MKENIEKILDEIRPSLEMHNGGVELIDVDEKNGTVKVKLQGSCANCPMSEVTLKMVIEAALQEKIPKIKEVVSVK